MGVHPKYGYSGSLSEDSSVDVLEPVSTSSTNNPPIAKREPKDSPTEIKRIRFATIREEEDYYYQKIQDFFKKKMDLFAGEDRLGLKKATRKRPRPSTDHEDEKQNRKIPKKTGRRAVVKNEVTEKLERFITGEMSGLDVKLVIQKILYRSDLKGDQNRLNMPIKQLETPDFLTSEEKKDLEDKKNMSVQLVGPGLQMYKEPMVLRKWSMERTKNYVLTTGWNSFVKDNKEYLEEKSLIQVWSFRKDQKLCFALVVVDSPDVVTEVA